MRDPFLDKLRDAIRTELTLRSGLTPDRGRALLAARFLRDGTAARHDAEGFRGLSYADEFSHYSGFKWCEKYKSSVTCSSP